MALFTNEIKTGKVVGPVDIPLVVWRYLGERAVNSLPKLLKTMSERRGSVLVPVFKNKADMQSCRNHRINGMLTDLQCVKLAFMRYCFD